MKKLTVKIIVALVSVFFSVTILLRSVLIVSGYSPVVHSGRFSEVFLGMIASGLLSLSIYSITINFMIVRRIKKLNKAVKEIEKGNYDIEIQNKSKDEIGTLMKNINSMARELRANEYLSKNFVKSFSHELKTPLSSIKGYSELIADGNLTKEEVSEYTDIIIDQINRLTALGKSMLSLSLLDSVEIISKEESFRVDEQIRSVLLLMQLEWERKNISFELNLEDVMFTGSKNLTRQIWQNLISNAIKFSHEEGEIRVTLRKEDKLYFEIQDFGTGIDEEDQDKIFTQFFIEDKARNESGSGLGLSIVQKIIAKLGGEIWFESKKDEGSTFYVTLD